MRATMVVLVAVLLLTACGAPELSEHAASVICLEMAKGGTYPKAADAAAEDGITDPGQAATAIRAAVREHCPAYLGTAGG